MTSNIKWVTIKPKESGRYLVAVRQKIDKITNLFFITVLQYDAPSEYWVTSDDVIVLCHSTLPKFPQFEPNLFSDKMEEFLDKVDKLCFDYGYEISAMTTAEEGSLLVIDGEGEHDKITRIDGDGRGK